MAKHIETGKFGEDLATEFLIKKGYKILERNYRHRRSEIDIIAEFNNEIIFVEVKTRHENYIIEPSISAHKIKHLESAFTA
jgi:putative endonuclease